MINILLVDDHNVMRQGLRALLEGQPDFRICGESGEGFRALDLVKQLHPDVLVIDIAMPDLDGFKVIDQVSALSPKTVVIVLSMHGADAYVRKAMQLGAKAYVIKESTAEELIHAIREVIAGKLYLSKSLSDRAIRLYTTTNKEVSNYPPDILTLRELDVLRNISIGKNNKQIADELCLSIRTIEFHRNSIMRKLGIHSQIELILYCVRSGILPVL